MTLFHRGSDYAFKGINGDYALNGINEEPCRSQPIPVHAEAAARILTTAARRIREGESVRDVCSQLIDPVIAMSGRI